MSLFWAVCIAYIVGGLTFIPLILIAILCHGYIAFPIRAYNKDESLDSKQELDESKTNSSWPKVLKLPDNLQAHLNEPDAAAGYFTVTREFIPGGANGKPPERVTPAGDIVATESPSVYQSMYRSLFDRGRTMSPLSDSYRNDSLKQIRKYRNVFFVCLRSVQVCVEMT
jgi:hypothetical protein